MTSSERAAFRARTRQVGFLLALVGAALTAMAVIFKLPFAGSAALLIVLGGAFWVGRRYLIVSFNRDPAPPPSR
jgi:hypothetical protein